MALFRFGFNSLRRFTSLALLCVLIAAPTGSLAQMVPATAASSETVEIPDNMTQGQVRDLISRLSDDQVRELVISHLDKLATEADNPTDSANYINHLYSGFDIARDTLRNAFRADGEIFDLPTLIWIQLTGNGQISGWFLLFQLIGLLVAGWTSRILARRFLSKSGTQSESVIALGKRCELACTRIFTGLLELSAFAAGALLFIKLSSQHAAMAEILWFQVVWWLVLIELIMLVVRQIVSLNHPNTCLISAPARVTKRVMWWTLVLTAYLVVGQNSINLVSEFGASVSTELLLHLVAGSGFIALLIALTIRLRHYGAELIINEDSGNIHMALARNWWLIASAYLLLIYFMALGKRAATGESMLVPALGCIFLFVMIPFFDMGLKRLIQYYFEDKDNEAAPGSSADNEEGPAESANDEPESAASAAEIVDPAESEISDEVKQPDERAPVYIATALRYARVLMAVLILGIFLRLWDIDARAIIAQALGERVSSALFDISITVLLTWALWGVIRISIERQLDTGKADGADAEEAEAGGLGGTRVETVLPLIKVFLKITLIVMAVLISLSSLGVNIGPLIAGAGVVGIAIGFGAQTLVRDIVSGFFYLIDDAFRIGEYVVIDQIRGTVEKISIRSFQLRHHNGPVHTIPYGEIRTLTNWSRDWSIMKFELRIAFETDIDMVRKIIKQIGIDIYEDPQFGPLMLAPMKSQGVNRMDDSALIIRCKFTSVPGQQYLIRREAFTRIQKVFEEKGIQFAPRRVVVEATTPGETTKETAPAIERDADETTPQTTAGS